jgi:hypothetical protein
MTSMTTPSRRDGQDPDLVAARCLRAGKGWYTGTDEARDS